jgi:hypothetical protein
MATNPSDDIRKAREKIDPNIRQYYETLGTFVTIFAQVESVVHFVLRWAADITEPIAAALFSGTRVDAGTNLIKRLGEAVGDWPAEKTARFEAICHQLGEITQTRNDLLHFGIKFNTDKTDSYTISNKLLAHTKERIRETKISAAILDNMTADLLLMYIQLLKFPHGAISRLDRTEPMSAAALKSAWRYKPERRSGRPKTTQ